jgi:hypothetical protein
MKVNQITVEIFLKIKNIERIYKAKEHRYSKISIKQN